MKSLYLIAILGCFIAIVQAWSAEDYEIFNLNDKIRADLGKKTTFYSWLELPHGPKATLQEITKAYRKKSRELHPDKLGGSTKAAKQKAEERFQRLSLVGSILRDQSLRRRYDYFYSKGFPAWKGTGYYYSKFRPGLWLTTTILIVIVGTLHYLALKINRKQDYKRIVNLKKDITNQAWGGSSIPPLDGSSRKVMNESTGKTFIIEPTGNIYLIEEDSNKILVDENDVNVNPFFKETLFFKLPAFLWNKTLGALTSKKIDTQVIYTNTNAPLPTSDDTKKATKKKQNRGEKKELPNGKVIYAKAQTRNRKKR